ncbi:endoglucanase [Sinosporangium album]|uniref:Endoglucanase n=1 Tax=Sinosporangium album TaxID=504805 RepID=A0A1G7VH23_9ACTN|nr:cellulase family glycosylhydrolase [Sinosporangium album]SDG59132.1 endoglucanase [Sinosporangium album]
MRRATPVLVLTGILTLLMTLLTPAAAHADTAAFAKTQDWGSGYVGNYTVKNTGSTALNGWTVAFELPPGTGVGSYWDAQMARSGSRYTFTNREYNRTVAPGGTVTFGWVSTGPAAPTACRLNGAACDGGGDPGDTTPPTVPGGLRVTATTGTTVTLAWNASTDDSGPVKEYRVYSGTSVVATSATTHAVMAGLAPNTAYAYSVAARDGSGNESAKSAVLAVRTHDGGGGTGTPVAANGKLTVCGTKLCNKNGKAVQLRGMSSHGLQWHADCITGASLDALADDWKADVVRLSMYIQEEGYETDPRLFTDRMHTFIDMVSARGMYVIVDWHMLTPGDPFHNLQRAKTFFSEIAERHGGKANILYEVANEPNNKPGETRVDWPLIKSYHEQIIPVIRAKDPDSVILLGTRAWSSLGVSEGGNESEVVNNPVNASNIMYTFHFYAASHGSAYVETLSRAADRIPVFVTEFGTQNHAGEGANDFTRSQEYLDLMARKKISWVNWNFSDNHRSGAVYESGTCDAANPAWAGTSRLKEAGVWVRDRVRTADDF